MSTNIRGTSLGSRHLYKYLNGEYSLDGVSTAGVIYVVSGASLLSSLPRVGPSGETHPLFGSPYRAQTYQWAHHPKVSLQVVFLTVFYQAPPSQGAGIEENEADSIAGEEAITSHPQFLQSSGGGAGIAGKFPGNRTVTPGDGRADPTTYTGNEGYFEGTPRTGAVFDVYGQNLSPTAADYNANVGKCLYFAPGFELSGELAVGLERYYVPRGTFARSYTTTVKPTLAGVGKIASTPVNAPALAKGYTWLLTRRSYRTTGYIYRVTENYQAGRWLKAIYAA